MSEGTKLLTMETALAELRSAVAFVDKVKAATRAEQTAVGQDHWDRLELAARRVAELSK